MKLFAAVLFMALLLGSDPAVAQLRVCNQTDDALKAAVAFPDPDLRLTVRGWLRIQPRSCVSLISDHLKFRYYFLHVRQVKGSAAWTGDKKLCVGQRTFAVQQHERCRQRGLKPVGFMKLDTGEQGTTFTYNLFYANQKSRWVTDSVRFRYSADSCSCEPDKRAEAAVQSECQKVMDWYAQNGYQAIQSSLSYEITSRQSRCWGQTAAGSPCGCAGSGTASCTFQVK